MGLDMCLNKRTYIGAEYKHRNITGTLEIKKEGKPVNIDFSKISYITEEAMYWRKSNHIHRWFVDNVQDGNDDCGEYEVPREKLQLLLEVCQKVLKDNELAPALLPTQTGFFFGGKEYDEWYFKDTQRTADELTLILSQEEDYDVDYLYRSSW